MEGFIAGLSLGIGLALLIANLALFDGADIKQCRAKPEWCLVQKPRLYEAITYPLPTEEGR